MVGMAVQNADQPAFAGSAQLRIADFRLPIAEFKQTLAACGWRPASGGLRLAVASLCAQQQTYPQMWRKSSGVARLIYTSAASPFLRIARRR